MVVAGAGPEPASGVELLGLQPGMIAQELGWEDDVDEELRDEVMDLIDGDLIEEADEGVDVVLLWQRSDTDVADALVDSLRDLGDHGYIWLLTPRLGRRESVNPADIVEAAKISSLTLTSSAEVSRDWHARKVVRPRSSRR